MTTSSYRVQSYKFFLAILFIGSFVSACGDKKGAIPSSSKPSQADQPSPTDRGNGTPSSSTPTNDRTKSATSTQQDCSKAREAYDAQIKEMENMGIFFQENQSDATPRYSWNTRTTRIEVKMKLDPSLATSSAKMDEVYASYEQLIGKVQQYVKACGSEISETSRIGLQLRAEISRIPLVRNYYKKTSEKIKSAESELKDVGLEFAKLEAKNYQQKLTMGSPIGWNLGVVESKNVDLQAKEVRAAIQNFLGAADSIQKEAVSTKLDSNTSSDYSSEVQKLVYEHGYSMGQSFEKSVPTAYGSKADELTTKIYLVQELKNYLEKLDATSGRANISQALLVPEKNMIIKLAESKEKSLEEEGYKIVRDENGVPKQMDTDHLIAKLRKDPFADKKSVLTRIKYSVETLVALQVLALDLADKPSQYLTEAESKKLMQDSVIHQANLIGIDLILLQADLPQR